MKIKIKEKDGVVILELEGSIGIDASDFVETVGQVLNHQGRDIVCNFTGVNLVDYVGVSLIAVVYKNVLNHKGKIELCNVPSHVRRLFSIVGLDRVFKLHLSEEQAIGEIKHERITEQITRKPLRRRFERIPLKSTIEYRQKLLEDKPFSKGKIVNLSAEGVFMASERVFSIGDLLVTRMSFQHYPEILEADVKVVWLVDEEIQPDYYPGMGLEFHKITAQKQEKIIQFVEKHLTHHSR